MAARLLNPEWFLSLRCESQLLDGQPVLDWVHTPEGPQLWAAAHGWIMPISMWRIMTLWLHMGGKAYVNRVDHTCWEQILTQVNPEQVKLYHKPSVRTLVETVFTQLNRKCNQGNTPRTHEWLQQIIQQMQQVEMQPVE